MVQEPAPVIWTVPGAGVVTVQLPLAARLTARVDEAVGLTPKSASPNVMFEIAANVIVWFALAMLKLCCTLDAALVFASPPCEAVMVQAPAPVIWTVPGDGLVTVQLPLAAKLTVRPEVAVALIPKSASPKVLFARAPNVIVWFALAMLKLCCTLDAALVFGSPAGEAVMVQAPAAVIWTVPGDGLVTVHCPDALKLTGKPELAVAVIPKSGSPKVLSAIAPKVIV